MILFLVQNGQKMCDFLPENSGMWPSSTKKTVAILQQMKLRLYIRMNLRPSTTPTSSISCGSLRKNTRTNQKKHNDGTYAFVKPSFGILGRNMKGT